MTPLLVLAVLAVAAANPSGYNYDEPTCKLQYATTKTVPQYKTNLETTYSTAVVPKVSTKYVTRIKVVPTYVYRTVVSTKYVPQEVVRSSTSLYVRNQVVTTNVKLPDTYVTRDVTTTVTKYVTKTQVRQVVRSAYRPTTIYSQVQSIQYVRSTVQVPRYVTTTVTQKVAGSPTILYKTEYATSYVVKTTVLPGKNTYVTKTVPKVYQVVKSEYLPAVTVTVTDTRVQYITSTYTDVKLTSRYTNVVVPVYVTSAKTQNVVRQQYVTSTEVRYTTIYQPNTQYVTSKRYVPTTQYSQVQRVVQVTDAPVTQYSTLPVYVTSTKQLPDTTSIVYRPKTVQKTVRQVVTVTRPEYRETIVTKTVQDKCGYSYPEPTVQLQYGK